MIFVTVGTWRNGYDRLVKAVDELAGSEFASEEFIAQIGNGQYSPKNMTSISFCSPKMFEEYVSRSRLVVSHAGIGTMCQAIRQGKPSIVLPRKVSLGEVDNDHQFYTARQLEAEKKVLVAYEASDLLVRIKEAQTFSPASGEDFQCLIEIVDDFVAKVALRKRETESREKHLFWPYRILRRTDDDIRTDLSQIMEHFARAKMEFDKVVFIPNAGTYLGGLFSEVFDGSYDVRYITARRASTVAPGNRLKDHIFARKSLADFLRHVDVLFRLAKYRLGFTQKMAAETKVEFEVAGKSVLVIDDDIATGTTLEMVKTMLLEHGAKSVTTASISNHFLPRKIKVDYSLYEYALLRTRNSRDYDAS